ncbi:hypothetical protein CQ010_18490 [Arthrobacter sp. MYb211]|nr:hypothetical protein CQ015_18465 [Arthrobacter sp. MYb221]PRC01580.1 hypothetical protein CQ010_18490 [Arthrobacter sp. MYb211]
MPIKYTDDLKCRGIDLALHAQSNPDIASEAMRRIANDLLLSSGTLRAWGRRYKMSGAPVPAQSVGLEAANKRPPAECAEF